MFYNVKKMKVNTNIDCLSCPYHNHNTNKCNGYGKCCFPMDNATKNVIDLTTGQVLTIDTINRIHNELEKES